MSVVLRRIHVNTLVKGVEQLQPPRKGVDMPEAPKNWVIGYSFFQPAKDWKVQWRLNSGIKTHEHMHAPFTRTLWVKDNADVEYQTALPPEVEREAKTLNPEAASPILRLDERIMQNVKEMGIGEVRLVEFLTEIEGWTGIFTMISLLNCETHRTSLTLCSVLFDQPLPELEAWLPSDTAGVTIRVVWAGGCLFLFDKKIFDIRALSKEFPLYFGRDMIDPLIQGVTDKPGVIQKEVKYLEDNPENSMGVMLEETLKKVMLDEDYPEDSRIAINDFYLVHFNIVKVVPKAGKAS